MDNIFRSTYLKINLDNLVHNINEIKRYVNSNVEIGAVLKADAYGHGAIEVAKALYGNGINYFLVSTLLEGLELKNHNKKFRVFIMGHTPDEYLTEIVKYDLECTIFTLNQAMRLNELALAANKVIDVHIKIDTGFNRLGMKVNDQTISDIKTMSGLSNINLIGIFSHLTLKDNESDAVQFSKFNCITDALKKESVNFRYKHICDSIGTVLYPEFQMDMVRVGAIIYGLESEERGKLNLKQVMSFHTKCSYIKKIDKGECISYGRRHVVEKDSVIATLPFGYADGYPRNMYQKGYVTINGQRANIVGVICMDQCMVDITNHTDITTDDVVTVFSDGSNKTMSVDELAKLSDTNKNEITSRFTRRVPKIYIKNENIFYIRNDLL